MRTHISGLLVTLLLLSLATASYADYLSDLERYAAASEHQVAGRLDQAITIAKEIGDPLLAEIKAVLIADCLVSKGEVDAADAVYRDALANRAFVEAGLYRGELLLGRAMAKCLSSTLPEDLNQAGQWLDEAIAWCNLVVQPAQIKQLRARVEEQSGPAILVPSPLHVSPLSAIPGLVVNPLTADWYVDHLRQRIALLRMYIDSQTGAAPHISARDAVGIGLYRVQADAATGAFLIGPEAWKQLRGDHVAKLRFALFLIVAERHDLAMPLFDVVNTAAGDGGLDSNAWSVALLGTGICYLRLGDAQRGQAILARFNEEFRSTPVTPLARYVLANHLAGSRSSLSRAVQLYSDVSSQHADSAYAHKSLLAMAVAAANHSDGVIFNEAQRLLRDRNAPDVYIRIADSLLLLSAIDPHADAAATPVRRRPGDPEPINTRVLVQRVLLPNHASVEVLNSAVLAESDNTVLRCHIIYGSRGHTEVDSLHIQLTELEPCPPAGLVGRMSFYRVPILSRTNYGSRP